MGARGSHPQSIASDTNSTKHDYRDRRLFNRLGCPTSRVPDRGTMVSGGETDAHKCTGTLCSVYGTEDLCQGQVSRGCFDSDGQCFSKSLHQSFRGNTLPSAELNCSPTVEMMPGSAHFLNSRASSRQEQSGCRRGIQSGERSL